MSVDIARQGQAVCQALLLGGVLGLVYDLMRVLRRRIPLPGLGGALDFLFWVLATAGLFLFSQQAWDGQVRLYGAVFCFLGGAAYFWGMSPLALRLGFAVADMLGFILGILSLPVRLLARLFKRFGKFAKNIFPFRGKWSMIKPKPKV